jgi:uncharacterized protein
VQLTLENPDFQFLLRGADGASALVNERRLERSFILAPSRLLEDWSPTDVAALRPEDLEPALALAPSVLLLGTGARLRFPAPAVLAACLTRGIGIEAMDNAAAARTFNVLAAEGRKVVAAFLLAPPDS